MGFIDDVEAILGAMPEEKQVALFSATMPDRIRKIVQHHLADPVEVKIKAKTATVAAVDQRFIEIRGFDKLEALTRLIEAEDFDAMLIFVRTRIATSELAEKLEARGFASAALSGEMAQAQRERTIERLRTGKLDIVVATDVAARGLDVERVTHVVNYDIPYDVEGYIHRIGRTGRAGRAGHAILLVMPRERRMLAAIERATRQPITAMHLPTRADVADRRAAQFKQKISEVLGERDLTFFAKLVSSYAQEQDKSPIEVAAALAYLAQEDRPLMPPPDATPHADTRRKRIETPLEHFVRYRIEVGHEHGVQPGNIVGAIANEAGIDSVHIGRIEIFDSYSTVDLPEGMPRDVYEHLRDTWVCGRKLALSAAGGRKPPQPTPRAPHGSRAKPHGARAKSKRNRK